MFYGLFLFFFKQKTAYEMRISDWSSDVCSSDLYEPVRLLVHTHGQRHAKPLAQPAPERAAGVLKSGQLQALRMALEPRTKLAQRKQLFTRKIDRKSVV